MSVTSSRTVLIIDDSVEDRAIIRRMLRDAGHPFTVVNAETGDEGLQQLRRLRPDCVLLDFRLPDTTALEFLDQLAGERGHSLPCPIAVLTGLDDTEAASGVLSRGAQDYVVKGTLSAHGLLRVIENVIEKFTITRELMDKRAILELRNRQLESIREQLETNLSELVDATRAKDRFMAVMSHEMRTPLNAVLGYADLLQMEIGGELNATQRDYVERIRVGSSHLLDLINDVLDLTRADARKIELDMRAVDPFAVSQEVVVLLESQAQAKGIELVLEPCEGEIPLVNADIPRLRQVVTNLVGNAIKFTDDGSVRVACGRVGTDEVEVRVEDTGIGIEPDSLPLIFTEFYQADGDLTRRQGGSGLGLAISQRLAQLMGGDIHVESTVGKGSTFRLVLPIVREVGLRKEDVDSHHERMEAHRARRERAADAEAADPSHVVVVAYSDNAEGLAELGRRVLPGVSLVWTTRVDDVPRLARQENASLVVLDISCDSGAGWHAAHALREDEALASIAVLLLPTIPKALAEEMAGGLDLGWISLVPKPFTHEQLTRAVQTAAHGSSGSGTDSGMEVLVVDDDADSRRVATKFLETHNVRVREVEDGETALIEMRRSLPNVVVLDLMMPVLDGFGVLAAMRADPMLTRLPVIVLSAKSLSEAERQFLARSAVRVLQKGEHRLSDVATLVMRAAASAPAPLARSDAGTLTDVDADAGG